MLNKLDKSGRKRSLLSFSAIAVLLGVLAPMARAQLTTIGFDDLADQTVVSAQYSSLGATFSGAPTVLQSDVDLGSDFPPNSPPNVVFNANGPIEATFARPVDLVEAYFTYTEPVTIRAYDSMGDLLGTSTSLFSANYASSGSGSPNELIRISDPGVASVVISTGTDADTFTMDDFTFGNPPVSSVPDSLDFPSIAAVLGCIVLGEYLTRRRITALILVDSLDGDFPRGAGERP
jgi:hypothetical protein